MPLYLILCGTKVHTLLYGEAPLLKMWGKIEMSVNIEGLNKADVLAALYNASRPMGLGFLQASGGPLEMTRENADFLLAAGSDASGDYPAGVGRNQLYFDYLHGRPLKLDLSSDTEFEPGGFDRDNGGEGTAQRVIDHLRETGSVTRADGSSFADSEMSVEETFRFLAGAILRDRANR